MAIPGTVTTYDLVTGVMLDMEDMIHLLSPFDTPLTGGVGADGLTVFPSGTATEKKVEWMHETLLTPKLTTAQAQTTGDTTILLVAGDRLKTSTGDILISGSEYLRITAYDASANTIDVTRGYASSSAGTIASGASLLVLGQALPEGSDPQAARVVDRTGQNNLTQIFGPTAITITATENVVKKYGLGGQSEFAKQVTNRIREHWIQLEQALMYGIRNDDTANAIRTMGGLAFFITSGNSSVLDTTTTTLSESSMLAMVQSIWDNGGNPDRAIMGSKNARLMSGFTTSGTLQLQRADTGRGVTVNYLDTDFGRISKIMDRWCRTSDVFVLDREQVQVATLRPLVFEALAKTGDSQKGMIVCEKTLKVRRFNHAGRFTALT